MKRGKISKMLGVSDKTITDWSSKPEFEHYFSPGATGKDGGSQRTYNDSDLLILNTIRFERLEKNTDWGEIAEMLRRGDRHDSLPPSALTVDTAAPIAQYAKIQVYEAKIEALEEQIDSLAGQLETERQGREVDRQQHRNELRDLEREHRDELKQLYEEVATYKIMLKMEQEQHSSKE